MTKYDSLLTIDKIIQEIKSGLRNTGPQVEYYIFTYDDYNDLGIKRRIIDLTTSDQQI